MAARCLLLQAWRQCNSRRTEWLQPPGNDGGIGASSGGGAQHRRTQQRPRPACSRAVACITGARRLVEADITEARRLVAARITGASSGTPVSKTGASSNAGEQAAAAMHSKGAARQEPSPVSSAIAGAPVWVIVHERGMAAGGVRLSWVWQGPNCIFVFKLKVASANILGTNCHAKSSNVGPTCHNNS